MAGEPNELPEGGEGGGFIGGRFPGRGPNPAELPIDFLARSRTSAALLGEIVRLRNRVHQFETQQLIAAVAGRRTGLGWPNELPEGGEGGGGFGGVIPGVIPGENPAELPIIDDAARAQVAQLSNRLATFEARVVDMLGSVQKQLEALKKAGPR